MKTRRGRGKKERDWVRVRACGGGGGGGGPKPNTIPGKVRILTELKEVGDKDEIIMCEIKGTMKDV